MSPWPGVLLWVILYLSDYYLTIYSARGFREIGHFQFEVFELTPQFQKEVAVLKPVSRLHLSLLVLFGLSIILIWWLTQHISFFPWTYLFYLGMLLLLEVVIHLRHLRNASLIREIRRGGGVEGQISYRRWFSYKVSASELYTFCVLFFLLGLLYTSTFFLGGAIACFATGLKHSRLAKKTRSIPSPAIETQP